MMFSGNKEKGGHPLSTHPKFSEKLTLLTPWYAHVLVHVHVRAYQGVKNVGFSENFAHVLNGWSQD